MTDHPVIDQWRALVDEAREADSSLKDREELRDLSNRIVSFFEQHKLPLVEHAAFNRLQRNFNQEKTRRGRTIWFVMTREDFISAYSERVFLGKTREQIAESIDSVLNEVNELDETTAQTANLFNIEYISDPYNYQRVKLYFYYKHLEGEIIRFYRKIFEENLAPILGEVYQTPAINKQLNTERFMLATETDFRRGNALTEVGLKNIGRVVEKLVEIALSGQKMLSEDVVQAVFATRTTLLVFRTAHMEAAVDPREAKKFKTRLSPEQKKDNEIKDIYVRLLTSLQAENQQYIGFFQKSDFVTFMRNRYPEVDSRRLELLFDQVVTPYPPPGVLKYDDIDERGLPVSYFVAQRSIHRIFDELNVQDRNQTTKELAIPRHHFLRFLHRLLDTELAKIGLDRMAKVLRTTPDKVRRMEQAVMTIKR